MIYLLVWAVLSCFVSALVVVLAVLRYRNECEEVIPDGRQEEGCCSRSASG
jgi:hypothetical protein